MGLRCERHPLASVFPPFLRNSGTFSQRPYFPLAMSLQPLLDYVNHLVPLTEAEGNLFVSKFKLRKYLKGQYMVQQGDVCAYESFVLSGCLKTFHVDPSGQEHVVMFAVENWWTSDLGS